MRRHRECCLRCYANEAVESEKGLVYLPFRLGSARNAHVLRVRSAFCCALAVDELAQGTRPLDGIIYVTDAPFNQDFRNIMRIYQLLSPANFWLAPTAAAKPACWKAIYTLGHGRAFFAVAARPRDSS